MTAGFGQLCFRCAKRLATVSDAAATGRELCSHCAGHIKASQSDSIELAPAPPSSVTRAPCPFCNAKLSIGTRVCGACGKDASTFDPDQRAGSEIGLRCEHCDYDLQGIKTNVCPECGGEINPGRSRQLEMVAQETLRREIRKPIIIGAIGLVLWITLFAVRFGIVPASIQLAIYPALIIATSLVFLICGALNGGIDPPMWLIALRMSAIVPAVKFVETIFMTSKLSGSSAAGLAVGGLVFAFLIVDLFDLDFADVRILVLMNSIAWFTIQFIIFKVI